MQGDSIWQNFLSEDARPVARHSSFFSHPPIYKIEGGLPRRPCLVGIKWPLTRQGRGAWHRNNWFQLPWDCRSLSLGIAEKELIPIVLASAAWGNTWRNQHILCQCDNQVVVACLHSRTSKTKGLMHLLRCLVFIEAFYGFQIDPLYINTHDNHLADDLSRIKLSSFLLKVPHADPHPSPHHCPRLCWTCYWNHSRTGYFQLGLAPSTQKTYQAAMKRFHGFC